MDRIMYTIPSRHVRRVWDSLGKPIDTKWDKGNLVREFYLPELDRALTLTDPRRGFWRWWWIEVNDPTDADQRFILNLFKTKGIDFCVKVVEVAWDLKVDPPGREFELIDLLAMHLTLPHARRNDGLIFETHYLGSPRFASKGSRIYYKREIDAVRVEVQINKNHKAYNLVRDRLIDPTLVPVNKLIKFRQWDGTRAAELAFFRVHGRRPHRTKREPGDSRMMRRAKLNEGVRLAHYRSCIEAEIGLKDAKSNLGTMMSRFRRSVWCRNGGDVQKVFPEIDFGAYDLKSAV